MTANENEVSGWVKTAAIGAGALALLAASGALGAWKNAQYPVRSFAVAGEAKGSLAPDMARVSFSVVVEGKSAAAIQEEGTKKMNSAIAFVKERGVEAEDVKTTGYELSPKYAYEEKRSRSFIDGYTLTQTAEAKVRALENVGEIVGGLVTAGANRIDRIAFEVEKKDELLAPLRGSALENAEKRARELAKSMGVRLGRVVTFSTSDNLSSPPIPIYAARGGMGADEKYAPPIPSIEPGKQEVTVYAYATYEIR